MRIRKRHVPFSSLYHSTVSPPSDPHLNRPAPPVVQPSPVLSSDLPPQPSDQISGWDYPSGIGEGGGAHKHHIKQDPSEEISTEDNSGEKKEDDSRKGGIFGSQTLPPPQIPPSHQDGRWCEEEKSIPLKKRRGSFQDTTSKKVIKESIKTKINNKYCTPNNSIHGDDDEDYDQEKAAREAKPNKNGSGGKKRKGRGSAVMEGSRCSRVNGRGWRCCQQTLVGYSLCEHHLGKGRLRSITSLRNRSKSVVIPHPNATSSSAASASASSTTTVVTAPTTTNKVAVQPQHDHGDDEEEYPLSLSPYSSSSSPEKLLVDEEKKKKKPATIAKKRMMKVGIVKARSISSLMGQTITLPPGETNNK